MTMTCTKFINKVSWLHKNFWGNRYKIIKDNKVIKEMLVYHKKIYILKECDVNE